MKDLKTLENEISNLYGGDTEQFQRFRPEILYQISLGKTIPEIVHYLFHTHHVMSTPDSFSGYLKEYHKTLQPKPSRRNKYILIEDPEYQAALMARAERNNCTYQYYSKKARDEKKNEKIIKKSHPKYNTISSKNYPTKNIGIIKQTLSELEKRKEEKWRELSNSVGNIQKSQILLEEIKIIEQDIENDKRSIEFREALGKIAKYLNTDINNITISYLR